MGVAGDRPIGAEIGAEYQEPPFLQRPPSRNAVATPVPAAELEGFFGILVPQLHHDSDVRVGTMALAGHKYQFFIYIDRLADSAHPGPISARPNPGSAHSSSVCGHPPANML